MNRQNAGTIGGISGEGEEEEENLCVQIISERCHRGSGYNEWKEGKIETNRSGLI